MKIVQENPANLKDKWEHLVIYEANVYKLKELS